MRLFLFLISRFVFGERDLRINLWFAHDLVPTHASPFLWSLIWSSSLVCSAPFMELDLVCLSAYFKTKNRICYCSWFGAILLLPHSVEAFCSLSAYFKSVHIINLLLLQFSYLVEVFALWQIKTGGVMSLSLPFRTSLSLSLSRRRNWECFSKIGGRSAQMTMHFKKLPDWVAFS
jgi:hypothetical protein